MRLYLYYFSHSLVNAIKRVMKTWLAIVVVCLVVGLCIGLVIKFATPSESKKETETPTSGVSEISSEEQDETEVVLKENGLKKALHDRGLSKVDLIDLVVSLVFFIQLAISVGSSSKAGRIFQPADVPMMFASPMKPQSVMFFRLLGSLAVSFLFSIYMLIQLPNLVLNFKLSVWGAVSLIVVYGLFLIFGTLIQVTFYTITSRMTKRIPLTSVLIVFFAALMGGFAVYTVASGKDIFTALFAFFTSKYTYFVPFWGWMRGVCHYAQIGEISMSILYLVLTLFAFVLLVLFIWSMKADFYEDALVATEDKSRLMEEARNASSGGVMIREKNRSEKVARDGYHYGYGATVFFFKPIYNRFRLAYLKLFSKTMIVYLIMTGGISALLKYRLQTDLDLFLIPVGALAVMVFYRTLGAPLREDITREFFVLVPASPIEKLWCSLLGGMCVTGMDILIPIIVAGVITQASFFQMIGWLFFILSLDFFSTSIGTFLNISVPGNTGSSIKTIVQLFFLYFGLAPSVVFAVVGVTLHILPLMLAIGGVINIGLASLFILFTPHFLVNR
ncbi:MAG: hypothetical protein KBT07_02755 [Clostridiales bacterium]|nr:hypothetical protein [Candidatus Scatonaster coprocaballi]